MKRKRNENEINEIEENGVSINYEMSAARKWKMEKWKWLLEGMKTSENEKWKRKWRENMNMKKKENEMKIGVKKPENEMKRRKWKWRLIQYSAAVNEMKWRKSRNINLAYWKAENENEKINEIMTLWKEEAWRRNVKQPMKLNVKKRNIQWRSNENDRESWKPMTIMYDLHQKKILWRLKMRKSLMK
jgi:hypothetical protein